MSDSKIRHENDGQQNRMIQMQAIPNFLDPALEWRRVFAETQGTFLLALVAAGGHITSARAGFPHPGASLAIAPGIMVMTIIKGPPTAEGTIAAQGTLGIDDSFHRRPKNPE